MINSFEEAMERISELEGENRELREEIQTLKEEIDTLRARNFGGRKKHNEAWMSSYNDFATKYESGMTITEIVDEGVISRRTAYRYKTYYDKLIGHED